MEDKNYNTAATEDGINYPSLIENRVTTSPPTLNKNHKTPIQQPYNTQG